MKVESGFVCRVEETKDSSAMIVKDLKLQRGGSPECQFYFLAAIPDLIS